MHGTGERTIPLRALQHIQRGGARTVDRPLTAPPSLRGDHLPYGTPSVVVTNTISEASTTS